MRKNLSLYILLIFLIIVNVFFLYNYLGNRQNDLMSKPKRPLYFLAETLGFNEIQQKQFIEDTERHHHRMKNVSRDIKALKDNLFKGLSHEFLSDVSIDSMARLIGDKETEKHLEIVDNLKQVKNLCTEAQKEKFNKIIKDVLRERFRHHGPNRGKGKHGIMPPEVNR